MIEGGTALAIFIRCFVDKRGIEQELERKLYVKFPRGVLAAITVVLLSTFLCHIKKFLDLCSFLDQFYIVDICCRFCWLQ